MLGSNVRQARQADLRLPRLHANTSLSARPRQIRSASCLLWFGSVFFLPKHLRSLLLPASTSNTPSCLLDSSFPSERALEMPLSERDTNIPLKARTHTPPSLKTPQLHSRLPRLVVTPNSAPAAKTWASRAADPVVSVERTASTLRYTPTYGREPTAIETVQKVCTPIHPRRVV